MQAGEIPSKNVEPSTAVHEPSRKLSAASTENEEIFSINAEDYEIKNTLGFGSSAIVYLAVYKPTGKLVAVKMIDLDRFERNQIDELRKEIQVMTLCKHPNLLSIHCSFVNDSKLWIVEPYLSAGSCLDIIRTAYPEGFEESVIATILYQALLGLEYLHKHGHIHRDVKAGNLLMDKDGLVQLADFGVSSSLLEDGERKGIRKTFVGTPCWMAPEVMEMTKGYNSKADIWSFGITALELAHGSAPFAKYPPMKVIYLTLSNNPPTLDRHRTKYKYSKVFKEMIDLCLQRDPNKRPPAETLLKHSFFKQAKKKQHLASTILLNLSPIQARSKPETKTNEDSTVTSQSWDFSDSNDESDSEWTENSHLEKEKVISENDATVRKGRFVVEAVDESTKGTNTPTSSAPINNEPLSASAIATDLSSAEVKKGRFCVVESKDSSVKLSRQPSLNEGELSELDRHLSKDEKRSRFEIVPASDNERQGEDGRLSRFTVKPQENTNGRKSRFKVLSVDASKRDKETNFDASPRVYESPQEYRLASAQDQISSLIKINDFQQQQINELMKSVKTRSPQHRRGKSATKDMDILTTLSLVETQIKHLMSENEELKSKVKALQAENELLRASSSESSQITSPKSNNLKENVIIE